MTTSYRKPYLSEKEDQSDIDAEEILTDVLCRQRFTVETRENLAEALRRIVKRELSLRVNHP